MSPQKPAHVFATHAIHRALSSALVGRAEVFCQAPLALSPLDEPEPDVLVVPSGDYRHRLPDRALLVVEVADATIRRDLGYKAVLYGRAGVPEYWVVNLVERRLVVHLDPAADGFRTVTSFGAPSIVCPTAFPDLAIDVALLMP